MNDREVINQLNKFIANANYLVEFEGVWLKHPIRIINIVTGEITCTDLLGKFRYGDRFYLTGLVESNGFEKQVKVSRLIDVNWRNDEPVA